MSIHRFRYLFQRFVNKSATTDERTEFLSIMQRDDYNEELQSLLDKLWHEPSLEGKLDPNRMEEVFQQILASSQVNKPSSGIWRLKNVWLKVAAILIIGLSALYYSRLFQDSKPLALGKNNIAVQDDRPGRRFINLPDGSSVILNEDSKITMNDHFAANGKREVFLQGEAYFDVVHDSLLPFIVHTGKLQTTVLGTAFNIDANSTNETVTITVTRGKVKVGDNKQTYRFIDPDQQVVYGAKTGTYIKQLVNSGTVVAWKNEDIYFDDVSLKDVSKQLQERFNVSILFSNDKIKNCRFTATFLKSQSLNQILKVIAEFNQINYEFQNKDTVTFDGTGCK